MTQHLMSVRSHVLHNSILQSKDYKSISFDPLRTSRSHNVSRSTDCGMESTYTNNNCNNKEFVLTNDEIGSYNSLDKFKLKKDRYRQMFFNDASVMNQ